MAASSQPTSPDPLVLPSSPLGARSARQSSVKPLAPRSSNTYSSPSKSFVMETGKAGDASPWRIKVTVEAEPKEGSGSPSKKRGKGRTMTVPLKGLDGSSGPAKKPAALHRSVYMDELSEVEVKRPRRKRKGTPIRRRGPRSQHNPTTEEDIEDGDTAALMPPPTSSATKARRRRSLKELPVPTQRSKRLSQAREELDYALQEAVGRSNSDDEDEDEMGYEAAGDMTLAGEEDFTMVSVETLQSMKADTSLISNRHEGEQSRLSVSYLPSSPPGKMEEDQEDDGEDAEGEGGGDAEHDGGVQYPNLSDEAREARTPAAPTYDAMSWKATGLAKAASPAQVVRPERFNSEPIEWRKAREAVSRQIENANPSQVITVDDDTVAGAVEDEGAVEEADVGENDDIWQEEASRSLEEESEHHHQRGTRRPRPAAPTTSTHLNDLFGSEPVKPRRAKIPRTWRRTSGVDFTYSDSLAHVEPLDVRKRDASTDGGGSRASSGVLTPPSTDDEAQKAKDGEEQGGEGDSDISLTRPDAEATRLDDQQAEDHEKDGQADEKVTSPAAREDIASPLSDSSSDSISPDGGDTGLFWQNNLPQVYRPAQRPRPQRQRAMDLSELLNLNKSSSPAKQTKAATAAGSSSKAKGARYSPLHMRPVHGSRIKSSPSEASSSKAVSSPLRKSLLRTSKIAGSPVGRTARKTMDRQTEQLEESAELEDSFASKASDQRQLLGEMAARSSPLKRTREQPSDQHEAQDVDNEYVSDEEAEEDDQEDQENQVEIESNEPSRSYEEHLNVESPQKIRVKFNDSLNSSLLAPRREYAPLFGPGPQQTPPAAKGTQQQPASPPTITLVAKKSSTTSSFAAQIQAQQQQQGIFSRLSTNFWSAVVRPSGPSEILPIDAASTQQTKATYSSYSPTLAAQIRSRYGVLSSSHPWTMAHMRTLHRMLNSCSSGKSDSIIPKTGPLPPNLSGSIGRRQSSVAGSEYVFTTQHAHVVDAFMQVLVPAHVVEAMQRGDVEMLGDSTAREYRGLISGRHGDDLVWGPKLGVQKSTIQAEFVVKALGDVVAANEVTARRAVAERERTQRA